MRKILAEKTNCWSAFLSCWCDCELPETEYCSTENDDWQHRTDRFLKKRGLCYVELNPIQTSGFPQDFLCGAKVSGVNGRPHVLIAKVLRRNGNQAFEVYHD